MGSTLLSSPHSNPESRTRAGIDIRRLERAGEDRNRRIRAPRVRGVHTHGSAGLPRSVLAIRCRDSEILFTSPDMDPVHFSAAIMMTPEPATPAILCLDGLLITRRRVGRQIAHLDGCIHRSGHRMAKAEVFPHSYRCGPFDGRNRPSVFEPDCVCNKHRRQRVLTEKESMNIGREWRSVEQDRPAKSWANGSIRGPN